ILVNRPLRIILRVGAAFGALVAVALVLSLDSVDYTPYFRTAYYGETMQRWRAHAATNKIAMGELAAGFVRAHLTPTVGSSEDDPEHGKFRVMPLAGYGDRKGRGASGVHDDLYIKAVALRVGSRTTVMIGADLLIMPREIADLATASLDREVGLSRE